MEKLFRIWFLISVGMLVLFGGWLFGRFGFRPVGILACVTALSFLVLTINYPVRKKRGEKKRVKRWSLFFRHAISGLLCCSFFLGTIAAKTNALGVNDWMDGSLLFLDGMIQPVRFFDQSTGKIVLDKNLRKTLEERLVDLHAYDQGLGKKILVSFRTGLATLEGRHVSFLMGSGTALRGVLSDDSLMLVKREGPQVLTRAVIRGDSLQKIWERKIPDMYLHHWGDDFEGRFYNPGNYFQDLPDTLSQEIGYRFGMCEKRRAPHDVIRIFDIDNGQYLETIDLMRIIASLPEKDDVIKASISKCGDPLHSNAIQIIKQESHAKFFPGGKVGDILVSLRNNNTIMLLDKDTHDVKWYVLNTFIRQHSPRITDRGTILVFDNKGSNWQNGRSRIVEIDIASRNVVGIYEARGNDFFESPVRGRILILDEHRFIVQEESPRCHEEPACPEEYEATMFILDCPDKYISLACKKTLIFRGKASIFSYGNAAILRD